MSYGTGTATTLGKTALEAYRPTGLDVEDPTFSIEKIHSSDRVLKPTCGPPPPDNKRGWTHFGYHLLRY
jgi:hypothetical protein